MLSIIIYFGHNTGLHVFPLKNAGQNGWERKRKYSVSYKCIISQLQLYPSLLCDIGIGPCKHFPFASWCTVRCCRRGTGEALPGDSSRKEFLSHFWFFFLQNPVVLTHHLNTLGPSSLHLLAPSERGSAVASFAFFRRELFSRLLQPWQTAGPFWSPALAGAPVLVPAPLHVFRVTNSHDLHQGAWISFFGESLS